MAHAVYLYFRFPLSLRMVEEMRAERGIVVSPAVGIQVGGIYAAEIRRRQSARGDVAPRRGRDLERSASKA